MRYLFEDFALDTERRELRRGGMRLPIEPQVFDVLVYLICNRERVVGKDDLLASVWRGRIVSESALTSRIHAARVVLGDSGVGQRFIKTFTRKGLRFIYPVAEEHESAGPASAAELRAGPGRPSIAVLPFTNLSNDPRQDYFCDGVVEDITTALSRNRALRVIARSSAFAFRGARAEVEQVAHELGVRYILEGSVRKSGGRMRVSAQLIEANTGVQLWADRFEGTAADIFELQDQVVTRVIGAIAPQLERAEIDRARRCTTEDVAAYDLYLRGLDYWNRWSRKEHAKALDLFYAAMNKDRNFSTPCGLAISCHLLGRANGWIGRSDKREISRLVERAADIGIDDPVALCWAGHAQAVFFGDVERALLLIDRALEIDVNLAIAWQRSGWVRAYAGDSAGAISSLAMAMQLNPLDPRVFLTHTALAFAHFIAGRDDDAAAWAATGLQLKPDWMPALRVSIVANAMGERQDLAASARNLYLRRDPAANINKICGFYPLRVSADRQRLVDGLRKAGIPG